ncbi:hypothetical protein LshimejAT787_0600090 [Lyophyllum shimeji]|uniref:Uncharacterized protein n=1 Tax=Lyophyllum shimeji TaxID=47721 RepID=A0A9P3UN07_LYOSH|nr:hypothetical protein LshimejAT787_0600090 [Lyophyllum shimeji]
MSNEVKSVASQATVDESESNHWTQTALLRTRPGYPFGHATFASEGWITVDELPQGGLTGIKQRDDIVDGLRLGDVAIDELEFFEVQALGQTTPLTCGALPSDRPRSRRSVRVLRI